MSLRRTFFLPAVLLLAPICVFSQKKKPEPVLFTVGKNAVTVDEFVYLYNKNHQNRKEDYTAEKVEEYLKLFINFKLKVAEAVRRGTDTTEAFRKEYNTYRDELRKPYLPDSKIVDSLVTLTYNRMKEEVSASHILINLKADAPPEDTLKAWQKIMGIRERALKGEDFSTMAATLSEDPSAKGNKGYLGIFSAMQMVYQFENAAFATPPGSISMPVRTRFGYHIVKVHDRQPSRGEIEVSHIMIRTGENKDNEKSKATIFEVYNQIQKGVSWDELVQQYSEDPSSKDYGGKLRPFGVGVMASVPEFERAAFELQKPGDISDPVQTQFGWHIIRLEKQIPLASFAEVQPSLRNRVSRDERVQLSRTAIYAKLKRENGYVENQGVVNSLLDKADSSLRRAQWKPAISESERAQTLFVMSGTKYAVSDFLQYAARHQRANGQPPRQYLRDLLNAFTEKEMVEVLEQNIMQRTPDYRWLLREYYEGILLFDIMEKEVWNKASIDSIGQLNYYERNKARYNAAERIQGELYSSTTRDHIAQLKKALEANDSTEAAAVVSKFRIKQERGIFEKADRMVLSKIPWQKGIFVAENNNLLYLIRVRDILPPGTKTFSEARPDVISDYQNHLEQEWLALLKKQYPVKVDKKAKQAALGQLVQPPATQTPESR